ncbi:ran-binding protein 9 [Antennarius striatus]|uniref:ran-binding protein 9 n=1 Tax=Antennarius striatus TaxID=241820 RepID=UPI0035AEFB03
MSGQPSGCGFLMSVVVHGDSVLNEQEKELSQRLQRLYPAVNETETPLPRSWSPKDKFSYIGLSQNNLRVHYKGHGKTPKDAASVRATHPIPAACGVYYFEVKIISKGRDGFMGIGLSAQGVNMNRLPGWDKHSYGYHGDDGHSFCSSGTGQPYGPTFTTGDVIGCCVNLINNTCFYTKNGHSLGIAFTDLPPNLYPTVGLQTPGEVVDANFGQHPFVFDIEDYMREWRTKIQAQIDRFPLGEREGEWQSMIQKMVASYLVHHSYCSTAEAFARSTDQAVHEELASIKNRQKIQKLVLSGRMGEAIETTQQLYPHLLERNPDLLFMLKVRQFIEMVNGMDSEVRCLGGRSPKSQDSYPGSPRPFSSPAHKASSSQPHVAGVDSSCFNGVTSNKSHGSSPHSRKPCPLGAGPAPQASDVSLNGSHSQPPTSSDVDMEVEPFTNGVTDSSPNGFLNGSKHAGEPDADMEVEAAPSRRQLCGGSQAAVERMIHFGRELQSMSEQLRRERGKSSTNKKMLKDAFSLLAYSDPWSSPVGYQLDSLQREPVCSTLNSAILETHNLPKQPPLAQAMGQAAQCLAIMARTGSGSCAFASVDHYLH